MVDPASPFSEYNILVKKERDQNFRMHQLRMSTAEATLNSRKNIEEVKFQQNHQTSLKKQSKTF